MKLQQLTLEKVSATKSRTRHGSSLAVSRFHPPKWALADSILSDLLCKLMETISYNKEKRKKILSKRNPAENIFVLQCRPWNV